MAKSRQKPIKVVIFLEGGLVQETFSDIPLEVTILDLDEHSQDRWVRTDSESSQMSEMSPELTRQYRSKRK